MIFNMNKLKHLSNIIKFNDFKILYKKITKKNYNKI